MSKGYIYILSNPSMPGLLKIGRSIHGGRQRAKEINQTGVPSPFTLEFEILVDDCKMHEAEVHNALSYYRESENREFFRVEKIEAIAAIMNVDFGCDNPYVVRNIEAIVDEDEVALYTYEVNKLGIDAHHFMVAEAISNYIDINSIISALNKYKSDMGAK